MRALVWLSIVGCSGSGIVDTGTPTDDPPTELGEVDCDDGIDNDGNTLVDCDEPSCAAEPHCAWPRDLAFETTIVYQASFAAVLAGYSDCRIDASARLEPDRTQGCAGCDRVYCGAFTYTLDTCPQDDGLARPTSGCFGLAFSSDTAWPVSFINPQSNQWEALGTATLDPQGWMAVVETNPIVYEGIDAGSLTTGFRFADRE